MKHYQRDLLQMNGRPFLWLLRSGHKSQVEYENKNASKLLSPLSVWFYYHYVKIVVKQNSFYYVVAWRYSHSNFNRKLCSARETFDKPRQNFNNNQVKIHSQKKLFRLEFSLYFNCYMGDSTVGTIRMWVIAFYTKKNPPRQLQSPLFLVRCIILCGIVTVIQWFEVTDVVKNACSTSKRKKFTTTMSQWYMLLHQWIEMQTWKMSLGHLETNFIFGI